MDQQPQQFLAMPPEFTAVIESFDARPDGYSIGEVDVALRTAREKLGTIAEDKWDGAKAELLAFSLGTAHTFDEPKGTYFGPSGSAVRKDGTTIYFPDPRDAGPEILGHWKARARTAKSPLLVARYSDLVWDLAPLLGAEKRDPYFVRRAIDGYTEAAGHTAREPYQAFPIAERALSLSIQLKDDARRDKARALILDLHKRQMNQPTGLRWRAWDIFERYSKAGLGETELASLVADLESVLVRVSNVDDSKSFDPHAVEDVSKKLAVHYRRSKSSADVTRVTVAVAKAFEHFGSLADPHLGSLVLQTSMEAYQAAGLTADATRILKLIGEKNLASVAHMTKSEHRFEIPREQVDEFLKQVVLATVDETFIAIASSFLQTRAKVEAQIGKLSKTAPLFSMISQTKVKGDRITAEIGSVADDPTGRLINHASQDLSLSSPFLEWAMDHAREVHELTASHFTKWANRVGLFGDGKLINEGVTAWLARDHVKALHVLIPQIEAAFRAMLHRLGRSTTKAYRNTQARMVVTMSEFLNDEETPRALGKHGPDLVLHLRALYADPRGWNLRNDMAHGLLAESAANETTSLWLIHTLLLFGVWVDARPPDAQPSSSAG